MVAEVRVSATRSGGRAGWPSARGGHDRECARKWLRQAQIDDSGVSRGGGVGNQPSPDR